MISKAKKMMSNISTTDNMVAKYELEIPIISLSKVITMIMFIQSILISLIPKKIQGLVRLAS